MLLNISNHPCEKWQEKQTAAAELAYGKIKDIPFPDISPMAESSEVKKLAETYYLQCKEILRSSNDKENAIHLMGEMTFTHHLVNLLQQQGFQCIASTTSRLVKENPEGEKTVKFDFQKFREYPVFDKATQKQN